MRAGRRGELGRLERHRHRGRRAELVPLEEAARAAPRAGRRSAREAATGSTTLTTDVCLPGSQSARSSASTSSSRAAAMARPRSRAASRSQSVLSTKASASTEDAPHSSSMRSVGTSGGRHTVSGARSCPSSSCMTSCVRSPRRGVPLSERLGSRCSAPAPGEPELAQPRRHPLVEAERRHGQRPHRRPLAPLGHHDRAALGVPREPGDGRGDPRPPGHRHPARVPERPDARLERLGERRLAPVQVRAARHVDPDHVVRDVEPDGGPERERRLGHARERGLHARLEHDLDPQPGELGPRRRHRLPRADARLVRSGRDDVEPRVAEDVALGAHGAAGGAR